MVGEDARRRAFILNILLLGSGMLALAAFVDAMANLLLTFPHSHYDSPLICLGVLAILAGLYRLSKKGFYQIGAWTFIAVLTLAASYTLYRWSIDLPTGLLLYALVITMTGILLGTRLAAIVAVALMALLTALGSLQAAGAVRADTSWMQQRVEAGDALTFSVILGIIALVSWLSNREIDRSLRRARSSEAALAVERDSLEVKVVERTRALEASQQQRLLEVQRFAEFGQLSASLLHDLANPLTVASLNLKELERERHSRSVRLALQSVAHLERYVVAARRQLQGESLLKRFAVESELEQVVTMLAHHAKLAKVAIKLQVDGRRRLFGDPVKFSQLAANLVINAIEAYDGGATTGKRLITVQVRRMGDGLRLSVQDYGSGIEPAVRPYIFDPFYGTKRIDGRNTGIGLSTVKQIAEADFGGKVSVTSSKGGGTSFVVVLHNQTKTGHG